MSYSEIATKRWEKIINAQKASFPFCSNSMILRSALCGFLAGDGSVQIRKEKTFFHYQIDFFPDDNLMLKTYRNFVNKLYRKKPSVRIRDNVYHVRMTSRAIVEDLLENADFGIKSWKLPEKIFLINGAKEFWLKGFFSAEAYVSNKTIRVQTVNKNGMLQISKILFELGIDNSIYNYTPKNKKWSSVTILAINKKEARIKYFHKIGFWHSKKNKALKKSLNL